ncbi:thiolase-like protein [Lactarius hengduanensis]|nr:thiolase-like protein [Lactarius hengduanensis]
MTYDVFCGVHVMILSTAAAWTGLEATMKALLDAGNVLLFVRRSPIHVHSHDGPGRCSQSRDYLRFHRGRVRRLHLRCIQHRPGGALGIPITDVNINCSTGSTALVHAAALVCAGGAHCARALGFQRMAPGALGTKPAFPDRPSPVGPLVAIAVRASPNSKRGPPMPCMFGAAAAEYSRKYGGGVEHDLAKTAAKNHKHSVNNPYAQFRAGYDEAAVLTSPQISNELTKFMCSPTSDGAACCILANETRKLGHRARRDGARNRLSRRTRFSAQAGASRDDVGVVELHDCFAANELVTYYPTLGLCAVDDAHRFVERGDNTYGGKYVVNPSGGLEAKGHPLGATGLAMHFSITSTSLPGVKTPYPTLTIN